MKTGGVRGAIFAVFSPSAEDTREPVTRDDGALEVELADAGPAPRRGRIRDAGRRAPASLEREGHSRSLGRSPTSMQPQPATAAGGDPPFRGRRGDRPRTRGARPLVRGRAAFARAGLEPAERVRPWRPVRLALLARHRPGPDRCRPGAGPPLRRARDFSTSATSTRPASGTSPRWCRPLVASHSAAHALCASSRNLTDRQLDAIGASGGLVGIVYAPPFLRPDFAEDPDTPIELIARHAAYIAERIGVEHVGAGLGLRRRHDPRRGRRRGRRAAGARRAREAGFSPTRSPRSRGATGAGCSTPGGTRGQRARQSGAGGASSRPR